MNFDFKWVEPLLKWLSGQPFNNVLLLTFLVGGFYCVTELVPLHINSIQQGYEKQEESHRAERREIEAQHTKQTDAIIQTIKAIYTNENRSTREGSLTTGN